MTRVAIATLGCRTNQDDSSALAHLLAGRAAARAGAIVRTEVVADLGEAVLGEAVP